MALTGESLSQPLFVTVVALPRVETQQNGADTEGLDLAKVSLVRSVLAETVSAPVYEPAGPGTYRLPHGDTSHGVK